MLESTVPGEKRTGNVIHIHFRAEEKTSLHDSTHSKGEPVVLPARRAHPRWIRSHEPPNLGLLLGARVPRHAERHRFLHAPRSVRHDPAAPRAHRGGPRP